MFFADGRIVVDANVELDCNRKNANIHARLGFIIGISIHGLREAGPSLGFGQSRVPNIKVLRAGSRMAIKNEGIDNENNRELAKTNLGPESDLS
jgi:hypothetical protein